jgi:hypothetical protein
MNNPEKHSTLERDINQYIVHGEFPLLASNRQLTPASSEQLCYEWSLGTRSRRNSGRYFLHPVFFLISILAFFSRGEILHARCTGLCLVLGSSYVFGLSRIPSGDPPQSCCTPHRKDWALF